MQPRKAVLDTYLHYTYSVTYGARAAVTDTELWSVSARYLPPIYIVRVVLTVHTVASGLFWPARFVSSSSSFLLPLLPPLLLPLLLLLLSFFSISFFPFLSPFVVSFAGLACTSPLGTTTRAGRERKRFFEGLRA